MGQKVHPTIFRIGMTRTWPSRWFASMHTFATVLREDVMLRQKLAKELKDALVDRVEIERPRGALTLTVYSAKPGMIIGRGGQGIEELKRKIKLWLKTPTNVTINVNEISNPSLSPNIVLQSMVADLEKRMPFRRVLKQALEKTKKGGALGAKVRVSGRLDGGEIARSETLSFGTIPLHTLRADIDYGFGEAHTIYGKIGVKVWVYRGQVFNKKEAEREQQ